MIFAISPKKLLTLAHDESKLDLEHYTTLQLYFIPKISEQYLLATVLRFTSHHQPISANC